MNKDSIRFPAEWESCRAVMIAWPHSATDWQYMLDEVEACYDDLASAIMRFAPLIVITPEPERIHERLVRNGARPEWFSIADVMTNDTWVRDYGFITTLGCSGQSDNGQDSEVAADDSEQKADVRKQVRILNDFTFNGWGLKFSADKDNLVNRRLFFEGLVDGEYRNRLNFVFEGGSIETDGKGTLMSTSHCLLSPNRNGYMTRREIGRYLKKCLGGSKFLWLDHGFLEGDDTDSHIDTLARMAPGNTIIYVGCQDPSDIHYQELEAMREDLRSLRNADGMPFNLVELPMPAPIYDEDGQRLPATYANYLAVNSGVLVPVYGQPKLDNLACRIIASVFPDKEIVPVDCRALIRQHGSLHCSTMQLP